MSGDFFHACAIQCSICKMSMYMSVICTAPTHFVKKLLKNNKNCFTHFLHGGMIHKCGLLIRESSSHTISCALLCRVTESQHNRIRTRPIWAFTKRRKNNAQFKNKRTCTDRFIHSHYHYHGIHTTRIYSARSYQRYDYSHSGNPRFTFLRT